MDEARFRVESASGVTAYADSRDNAAAAAFALLTDGEGTPIVLSVWNEREQDYLPTMGTYGNIG